MTQRMEGLEPGDHQRRKCLLVAISAAMTIITPVLLSQERREGWGTTYATTAMELVAVESSGPNTVFVVKNVSGRPITAFSVSHDAITDTIDYFHAEGNLQSGATYRLLFSNAELSRSDHILRFSAVIFEDGSADGTKGDVDFIRGKRLGRLFETERVRNTLEAQGETIPSEAEIKAIRAKVGGLPESPAEAFDAMQDVSVPGVSLMAIREANSALADGFKFGTRNAREDALWKLNQLIQSSGAASSSNRAGTGFFELRKLYRTLSGMNREFLAKSDGRILQ